MKTFLFIIYFILGIVLTAITLMQSGDDEGLSGAITGGASSSFYEKNKGRTKEGQLKKITIILGVIFIIYTIILGIITY